jgi:hypothetical protein
MYYKGKQIASLVVVWVRVMDDQLEEIRKTLRFELRRWVGTALFATFLAASTGEACGAVTAASAMDGGSDAMVLSGI